MKALLNDIDYLLARIEDTTVNNVGEEEVARMRKRLAFAIKQEGFPGQLLCIHSSTEVVPGVFGGVYCNGCGEKIE